MIRRLGVIGAGGIADILLSTLADNLSKPLHQIVLLGSQARPIPPELLQRAGNVATTVLTCASFDEFLNSAPDIALECAGREAVCKFAEPILATGCDLFIASTSALVDDALRLALQDAAAASGATLTLAAGAVGAIDILSAARLSGIDHASYVGRKPPQAWRGTPAERIIDLSNVCVPTQFFTGRAREAASAFPQNANVAATYALAGAGFDRTDVSLIADPTAMMNTHEFTVRSACVNFTISIEGHPSQRNAKTSQTAGYSMAHHVLNRLGSIAF